MGLGGAPITQQPSIMQQQAQHSSHGHSMHFEQLEQQAPVMDEFLDQMFAMPPFVDMGNIGAGRVAWDYNAASSAAPMAVDNIGASAAQKLFTMSLMPPGLLNGVLANQVLKEGGEGNEHGVAGARMLQPQQQRAGPVQDSSQQQQPAAAGIGEARSEASNMEGVSQDVPSMRRSTGEGQAASAAGLQLNGSRGVASLTRSASLGSSGSEDSGGAQPAKGDNSPPPVAPTWRQPYVGSVAPLPMTLAQAKAESIMGLGEINSHDTQSLGKRFRDDDEAPLRDSRPGTTGVLAAGVAQGQGYGSQGGGPQPQSLPAIGARPRVRARRGQATDPHSIAERLRRERIAERMKALQELVPNSNKTDKASMLDEIIDYVKFLQLQVKSKLGYLFGATPTWLPSNLRFAATTQKSIKRYMLSRPLPTDEHQNVLVIRPALVLSMSRLGGAGALAPHASDLPTEGTNFSAGTIAGSVGSAGPTQDGLALTERQVTRMMEDDMGSAMQYLQSKGLCLMPISLATAISTTNTPRTQGATGDRQASAAIGGNTDGSVENSAALAAGNATDDSTLEAQRLSDAAKSPKGDGKPEEDSQGRAH